MKRIDHSEDYMDFVMIPPKQGMEKYSMYVPQVGAMKVLSSGRIDGLGELPVSGVVESSKQADWVMPVVVIVVSAMALMTLYAVLSDRKR